MSRKDELSARLDRLRGYLKADAGNLALLADTADTAIQLGQGDEALLLIEQGLSAAPNDKRLQSLRGNALMSMGRLDEAAGLFEALIDRNGPEPALNFNLALARMYQGLGPEAQKLLESIASEARTGLPDFDLHLAQATYQALDYEGALKLVNRFLESSPDDQNGIALKALLLLDTEQNLQAVALAQALIKAGVRRWEPHLVVGSVALFSQDANVAEAHFAKALEMAPTLGRAWSGRGFAAMIHQNLPRACEYFEKAVTTMKDHPGTWHGLAWGKMLQGDLDAARSAIDQSMIADRNFADNHGTVAVLDVMQGRYTEAELSIRKALRLNPASPSALYARSLLQDVSGDYGAAEATVEKILAAGNFANSHEFLEMYKQRRRAGPVGPGGRPLKTH